MIKIHSIETFGTHEGPGIRLVVFMQGCDFRCLYCQNPDTQDADGGREISATELIDLLEKEKEYFAGGGGITFSGGEPTFQSDNLLEVCREIKKAGYHITLDTNGSILQESTKKLYDVIDLVLLDVKHIDNEWHKKITGKSNETVLKTSKYLEDIKKPFWIRVVLVPGYSDQMEYLEKLAEHFKDYEMVERIEVLPYHTLGKYKYEELGLDYPLEGVPTPNNESVEIARKILNKYKSTYIR